MFIDENGYVWIRNDSRNPEQEHNKTHSKQKMYKVNMVYCWAGNALSISIGKQINELTFDKCLPDVSLVLKRLVVETSALLLTEVDRWIWALLEII